MSMQQMKLKTLFLSGLWTIFVTIQYIVQFLNNL